MTNRRWNLHLAKHLAKHLAQAVPLLVWLAGVLGGCAIDTELGLVATIDAARVSVAADDSVSSELDLTYRVGPYAEGNRVLQPQAVELYVDDVLIGSLVPERPPGFVDQLAPGESATITLPSASRSVVEPRRLCGATVTVIFRYLDAAVSEMGIAESSTMAVTCP